MAHIVFISLYDRNAYGQRLMCSNLKRNGHQCDMIFLKRYDTKPATSMVNLAEDEYPWMGINKQGRIFKFASSSEISDIELGLLRETLERLKPDMVGITVNTPLRKHADRVTKLIKETMDVPVLWGGYDPTVNFDACLELADYVCVGEGDQTVLDIADCIDKGVPFDSVPNIAYKRDGKKVVNPKYKAEQVLDTLPWRDNDSQGKWFIEDNRVDENHAGINDREEGVYETMSARGCPYKCTYCCEATLKDVYSGEKFLRRRSPENVIAELVAAKKKFGLKTIHFHDEIFAMDVKWLEKFVPMYKAEIGLPIIAYIYPTRSIETILDLMKDAGLFYCCLALESGSERMNKLIFDRVYNRELFLLTAKLLKERDIRFYTDVITYSPYEEEEDLEQTLDALLALGEITHSKFDIWINKLFVLPGTKLASRMVADGALVGPSPKDPMFNFYSRLFWIASFAANARPVIDRIKELGIFREQPWLLNPERVEQWLTVHTPADAASLNVEDIVTPSLKKQAEAMREFREDHMMDREAWKPEERLQAI